MRLYYLLPFNIGRNILHQIINEGINNSNHNNSKDNNNDGDITNNNNNNNNNIIIDISRYRED